jgi:cytochrome c553
MPHIFVYGIRFLAIFLTLAGQPVSAATVADPLTVCLACHGEKGQSIVFEVPSLGAQPAFYLSIQLVMYREKLRIHELKNIMLKGLSDDTLQRMAEVIAKLPAPPPAADPPDPGRSQKARALIEQHRCNFCHTQDFTGEKSAPRLAAQREDYLIKSLREYKNNTRHAYDPSMADVMTPLTDADILDLAHYLARLP